ncbi:MAG: sarcosine oxidase subunit delta [Propionibacteriales bacterium]|nr:sarcosine oxidase subunit delta [Propionibacteriales bacterium]
MMLLTCPHCGARDAGEFDYVGERRDRPDVSRATEQEWRGYLYLRGNRADWTAELWHHRAGCERFLTVVRHLGTDEVRG